MSSADPHQGFLGMHLRRGRVLYGIGLNELAADIGVSGAYLSRVENGRVRPSDKVLQVYADRFRMSMDELSRLASRIPRDIARHLVTRPGALERIRQEMTRES
jgi:transcriptional regulator with XRE-family HTH domain